MILLSTSSQHIVSQFLTNDSTAFGQLAHTLFMTMIVTVAVCFVLGELTRNYSQVDKIWSLMPIVYSMITLIAFPYSARIWLMTVLVTLWGLRLSFNFYRKGGYNKIPWKGEEDYRWEILRQNPKLQGFRIVLFNLFFISLYQQFLIFLFSMPLLLAARNADMALSELDYVAAIAMLIFLIIETTADNQLFNFHLQKRNKKDIDGKFNMSLEKGFMVDGLWKYVRHPNFISEQMIWVSFYLFGVAASGEWINWTLTGPVLLILLFIGSSDFTESISLKKYPEYSSYKQRVPRYFPFIKKIKN